MDECDLCFIDMAKEQWELTEVTETLFVILALVSMSFTRDSGSMGH